MRTLAMLCITIIKSILYKETHELHIAQNFLWWTFLMLFSQTINIHMATICVQNYHILVNHVNHFKITCLSTMLLLTAVTF